MEIGRLTPLSLRPMNKTKLALEKLAEPVETKTELLAKAAKVAEFAPPDMRRMVELYYLTRYMVVLHEANFDAIPIQVWNEYRNALDHLIRHLTNVGGGHVKSMEGHIQRALLDICKLHCHRTNDLITLKLNEIDAKVLSLLDNGAFAQNLREKHDVARELFINAKTIDLALGDDAMQNKKVLDQYLDATYSHFEVLELLRSRRHDIINAQTTITVIKAETTWEHLVVSLAAKGIWYVLTAGGGALVTLYLLK
jgi:hypothetical protein